MAAAAEGQLVLLYVEAIPALEPEIGLVVIPEQYYQQEHNEMVEALAAHAQQLPAPTIIEHQVGGLHDVLVEVVKRWHPQLLVMGLAAEHDVLDEMMLNHALPALRNIGLPLLLVPEFAPQKPALPRLIAVAADSEDFRLTPASLAFLPLLHTWAAAYTVVHIATPKDPDDGGIHKAYDAVRHSTILPPSAPSTTYQIRYQPVSRGIVQATLDVQADLLVLMARPRTLLASIFGWGMAAEVVRACPVPVLLLPTADTPKPAPH
jgi:nucleotide-binding universal stress UspA family protein